MGFMDANESSIYLYISEAARMKMTNMEIVSQLTAQGTACIIVTTNIPSSILTNLYTKQGIAIERLHFIDAITKYSLGSVPVNSTNTTFTSNPGNLTELGIAISEALKKRSGEDTALIFDSISTLLIYLSSANISKFIHFISNKIRLLDLKAVYLSADKGLDPLLFTQISSIVDEVIDDQK
ncbi:MAG: hypothetical protein D5R99_07500 [Methanocalculus sp. MSAO_Arc1]|uniref:DUF7504 family protein n=1 Tax=Methanocalculus TaxID=71151 RepID=UPI000FF2B5A9|nr:MULTISPECIES: hypothetical protein [unclassified Methanocalculus]MCP1661369.1 KaiC/GvpD/RAD55 family RecA-like ATPase [Methanocalculus sp. AMF5]RQD79661.1 MAG: hypothetical protein D5R99_07500 [Methanocalculus sp. MSAO_Arc1]